MVYWDRYEYGYAYKFPGDYYQEAYQITNFGPWRRLDGLSCDFKGFQYLLTKSATTNERQRLQIKNAEEDILRTPAEIYVAHWGLRRDMADKRRSIRRGCTHDEGPQK